MKLDEDSSDEEFHNYNQKSPELSIDNRGPSIKVMDQTPSNLVMIKTQLTG